VHAIDLLLAGKTDAFVVELKTKTTCLKKATKLQAGSESSNMSQYTIQGLINNSSIFFQFISKCE